MFLFNFFVIFLKHPLSLSCFFEFKIYFWIMISELHFQMHTLLMKMNLIKRSITLKN